MTEESKIVPLLEQILNTLNRLVDNEPEQLSDVIRRLDPEKPTVPDFVAKVRAALGSSPTIAAVELFCESISPYFRGVLVGKYQRPYAEVLLAKLHAD